MAKRAIVSVAPDGEDAAARRRRRRTERALLASGDTSAPKRSVDASGPQGGSSWGDLMRPHSGWGPAVPSVLPVTVSSRVAAATMPFLNGVALGAQGAYLGRLRESGAPFAVDQWAWYRRGVVTNTAMVVIGDIGAGKSSMCKAVITRQMLLGYRAAVVSDPKGEWAPVAREVGGVVVRIGPGLPGRLNPLDPLPRLDGESDLEYRSRTSSRRQLLLISVLATTLHRDLEPVELTVVDVALQTVVDRLAGGTPTLNDVFDELSDPSSRELRDHAAAVDGLRHGLRRLVRGDLAGMFDGPSTVAFDASAPMTVMDTGAFQTAGEDAQTLASLLASEWLESAITTGDGRWNVVYDEGYRMLRNRAQLQRMSDRWKLARSLGMTNVLIMHRVTDLDAIGDEGSEARALAKGLLSDTQIKVVGQQEADVVERTQRALGISDTVASRMTSLGKGEFIWVVNGRPFDVQTHLTPDERDRVYCTDGRVAPDVRRPAESIAVAESEAVVLSATGGDPVVRQALPEPALPVPPDISRDVPIDPDRAASVRSATGQDALLVPGLAADAPSTRPRRAGRRRTGWRRAGVAAAGIAAVVGVGAGALVVTQAVAPTAPVSSAPTVAGLVTVPLAGMASPSTPSSGVGVWSRMAWDKKIPAGTMATATLASIVMVSSSTITLLDPGSGAVVHEEKVASTIKWVSGGTVGGADATVWLDGSTVHVWRTGDARSVATEISADSTVSQTGANPLFRSGDRWSATGVSGVTPVAVPSGLQPVAADDGTVVAADAAGNWNVLDLATGTVTARGVLTAPVAGATLTRWVTVGWGSAVALWSSTDGPLVTLQQLATGTIETVRVSEARAGALSSTSATLGSRALVGGLVVDLRSARFLADVSSSAITDWHLVGVVLTGTANGGPVALSPDFAQTDALSTPVVAATDTWAVAIDTATITVYTKGES